MNSRFHHGGGYFVGLRAFFVAISCYKCIIIRYHILY